MPMPIDGMASECMLTSHDVMSYTFSHSSRTSLEKVFANSGEQAFPVGSFWWSLVQTVAICLYWSSSVLSSLCTCTSSWHTYMQGTFALPPSLHTSPLLQLWLRLHLQCLQSAINARSLPPRPLEMLMFRTSLTHLRVEVALGASHVIHFPVKLKSGKSSNGKIEQRIRSLEH